MGRATPTEDEPGTTTRVWSVGGMSALGLGVIGARAPTALEAFGTLATTPLQAELGEAACEIGLGVLLTAVLWGAAVLLAYLSIIDLVGYFAKKDSKSTRGQQEGSEHLKSSAMKMFGAVVVAGAPTILAGLGFTLLDCVDAVDIFSAVIIPLPL